MSFYYVCVRVSSQREQKYRTGGSLSSAGAEDDVDARVSKNGPAHVSHFKSKGGVFKRLLHLT